MAANRRNDLSASPAIQIRLSVLVATGLVNLLAATTWAQTYAVPPGQEATIRTMVAGDDSWPCTLRRTQAGPDRILAEYDCDGQRARLVLDHPTRADGSELARTERFVIRLDDDAPPRLALLIEAGVRAGETSFRWRTIAHTPPRQSRGAHRQPPAFSSPILTFLRSPENFAITVLLLAACLFVIDRKARRQRVRRS